MERNPYRRHHDVHDQGRRLQAVRGSSGSAPGRALSIHEEDDAAGHAAEAAAEIIVNEILADSNIRNFSVTENIPARSPETEASGWPSSTRMPTGTFSKRSITDSSKADSFYNIRYGATQEEYFQKDLKTFEEVFKSFKLVAVK